MTGFKTKISPKSTLPSCVNETQRAKHSKFEPTVDSILELIEEQVFSLNKDEQSLDGNLDFIGKSMQAIVLSRTDTFKEHIIRAYVAKEEELETYKNKCEGMEINDAIYKN